MASIILNGEKISGTINEICNYLVSIGYSDAFEENGGITAVYYFPKDWDWDEYPPEEYRFKFA